MVDLVDFEINPRNGFPSCALSRSLLVCWFIFRAFFFSKLRIFFYAVVIDWLLISLESINVYGIGNMEK